MRRRAGLRASSLALSAALLLALGTACPRDRGSSSGPPGPTGDAGSPSGGDAAAAPDAPATPSGDGTLARFGSDEELARFVEELASGLRRPAGRGRAAAPGGSLGAAMEMSAAPSAAAASEAEPAADGTGAAESITNVQEAGVDEGGIVKVHGDHLVVLRRGRLFSVSLAGGSMRPVSMVDAFPPGSFGRGWYDEMLISGDTIVVVGFSSSARATELGLFHIDREGVITHRKTYFLRSNDYYSSRNYASRLLGDRLVYYMPYRMLQPRYDGEKPRIELEMPAVRQWSAQDGENDWSDVIGATRIYRPVQEASLPVLHVVVTCELSAPEMSCSATGVLGPGGRVFYVSRNAVYLWLTGGSRGPGEPREAAVYRLPLDGGEPGVLWTRGAPIDQLSFREDPDGYLNVLVRADGRGDGMWGAEGTAGGMALLRAPLAAIGPQAAAAAPEWYSALPDPGGHSVQNRFVGDHVLYGAGSGWRRSGADQRRQVFAFPYRTGGPAAAIDLPHAVDRIEVMGRAAVVVGGSGTDLHFSAIDLGDGARLAGSYVQENAAQGEQRTHGFFYLQRSDSEGILGLPVRRGGSPGYAHLRHGSAEVLYLGVRGFAFSRLGALASSGEPVADRCVASCTDWYGNARPIFLRGRVFALLGYELVEGRLLGDRIEPVGRVNFFTGQPSHRTPG